jgi:hypothetical protein
MEKKTLKELTDSLVTMKMNCTRDYYNITKLLKHIHPTRVFDDFLTFLKNEKVRLDKDKMWSFSNYYDSNIIETVENIVNDFDPEDSYNSLIISLKNSYLFREFNWKNFNILNENNLFHLLGDFDSDFRGEIKNVHKVNGKYIIIETYKFDEGYRFYNNKRTSYCFDNFEDSLFYAMFGEQHYSTISLIFKNISND